MLFPESVTKHKDTFCQMKYIQVPQKAASTLFQHWTALPVTAAHWSHCSGGFLFHCPSAFLLSFPVTVRTVGAREPDNCRERMPSAAPCGRATGEGEPAHRCSEHAQLESLRAKRMPESWSIPIPVLSNWEIHQRALTVLMWIPSHSTELQGYSMLIYH